MAAIDIPDEYWTIEPRGFAALVQPYSAGLDGIRGDLLNGTADFGAGSNDAVATAVGDVDADSDVIAADAQGVYDGVVTADTEHVLSAYGTGDALHDAADALAPPPELPPGASHHKPTLPEPPPTSAHDPSDGTPVGIADPIPQPPQDTARPKTPNEGEPSGGATSAHGADASDDQAAGEVVSEARAPLDLAATENVGAEEPAPVDPATLPITRGELAQVLDALSATIVIMV